LLAGIMRDKAVAEMLMSLARSEVLRGARFMATGVPGSDRAMLPSDLAARWVEVTGQPADAAVDDPEIALERALTIAAHEGGPLVIAGSLYLVGHLRARIVPDAIGDDRA
jgi:folylpolyglutamate synthase/dihydropteroate synthase